MDGDNKYRRKEEEKRTRSFFRHKASLMKKKGNWFNRQDTKIQGGYVV